jgi:hypothetical protein
MIAIGPGKIFAVMASFAKGGGAETILVGKSSLKTV